MTGRMLVLLGAFVAASGIATAETYVVRPDGSGDYPTIQAAIDAAVDGDIIELADGTFVGDGNRGLRYWGKSITVRSQSGNPEACIIDCEGEGPGFTFGHEGQESILAGVTITNASMTAVVCYSSSPSLLDCIFLNNTAGSSPNFNGGGVYCFMYASPTLLRCTFSGNTAPGSSPGAECGAGLACEFYSHPTLSECIFASNEAGFAGGVACLDHSAPRLTDCRFVDNVATGEGGAGLGCVDSSPVMIGCSFEGNVSINDGGGVYCLGDSEPQLVSCTFTGNTAEWGGGVCSGAEMLVMTDCWFSDNRASWGGGLCFWTSTTAWRCTFVANVGETGGGVLSIQGTFDIESSTFDGNAAPIGGGVAMIGSPSSQPILRETIITGSPDGCALYCEGGPSPILTCCDLFANAGGDWIGCIAELLGTSGNISENPLFCDAEDLDFTLRQDSPCRPFSPPNEECDLIGAWPVGCWDPQLSEDFPRDSPPSADLRLSSGAPNPFRTSTRITYCTPAKLEGGSVLLTVHDAAGRLVRTLVDSPQSPGTHKIAWNGASEGGGPVAGGVYFLQLRQNGKTEARRLLVVR